MNAKVTLYSDGERTIVDDIARPPAVGTRIIYKGKDCLVTAYEQILTHRVTPFEMVLPR